MLKRLAPNKGSAELTCGWLLPTSGLIRLRWFLLPLLFALSLVSPRAAFGATDEGSATPLPSAMSDDIELHLTPAEKAWLRAHPIIRLGMDPAWPPFSMVVDGRAQGLDPELLAIVAERLGVRFELQKAESWAEALRGLYEREIDVTSGTAWLPERAQFAGFTQPYLSFPVVIVSREDGPFFVNLASLHGRKVAAPRDYVTTIQLLREHPGMELVMTENPEQSLLKLSRGEVDATVENIGTANYLIKKHGLSNLKISGVTSYEFDLRLAVRSDWPELVPILDKALASIAEREFVAIQDRWIVLQFSEWAGWRRYRALVLTGLVIALLVAAGAILWNRRMAAEIARREELEMQLESARERAERANAAKSDFLARMSHEVRNPLTAILGFAELLKKDLTDPRHVRHLEVVQSAGQSMLRIVGDALDLSRIEAGRLELHPKPIDLRALLSEEKELFHVAAEEKKLDLVLEVAPDVPEQWVSDELRLRQILTNLIGNAIKFTASGKVEVRAMIESPQGAPQRLVIEVADTGIGIASEDHHRVFEPFRQAVASKSSETGGTGLGLPIARSLTNLLGGRLELQSEPGAGSVFRVLFPLKGGLPPEGA